VQFDRWDSAKRSGRGNLRDTNMAQANFFVTVKLNTKGACFVLRILVWPLKLFAVLHSFFIVRLLRRRKCDIEIYIKQSKNYDDEEKAEAGCFDSIGTITC